MCKYAAGSTPEYQEIFHIGIHLSECKPDDQGCSNRFEHISEKNDKTVFLTKYSECICGARVSAAVISDIYALVLTDYKCGLDKPECISDQETP